jgi:hypothetical protein
MARLLVLVVIVAAGFPAPAAAQVRAQPRAGAAPPWTKGILAINPESYYHAIECGKQGGEDPPCVFWDTGLCRNDDFALAMYTPYKQVAYEVWTAIRKKQPAPTPNYQAAQRTRITIGVTPVKGSTNVLTDLIVRRAGKPVARVDGSAASGRFTFDYPAFAATGTVTLEMVGKSRTISCTIDQATLRSFR